MNHRAFTLGTLLLMGFILISSIVGAILVVLGAVWLVQNPQAIGEFFGKIVSGFTSAK